MTLLNIHKPRDRSHYERFRHFHETFYRSVEVGSVTPFSARALDRGFAGALVALARHLSAAAHAAARRRANRRRPRRARATAYRSCSPSESRQQPIDDEDERAERLRSVQSRIVDLLDSWQSSRR